MGQKSAAKIANSWLRQYILLGYVAKGTVYLSIGIFAVRAALVLEREVKGTYLSLISLARQPLGRLFVLLLAIAVKINLRDECHSILSLVSLSPLSSLSHLNPSFQN